jgi:hypothetical protein
MTHTQDWPEDDQQTLNGIKGCFDMGFEGEDGGTGAKCMNRSVQKRACVDGNGSGNSDHDDRMFGISSDDVLMVFFTI